MEKLIKGISEKVLEEFLRISGPYEKLLNKMLKYSSFMDKELIL
jgi:hypothetical protein